MPVGRTRKGKFTAAMVRHSIAATLVSDEDGNASEDGESTMACNNAVYNNQQQQQQQHSNDTMYASNHSSSQCAEENDQNRNDTTNSLNLNNLDIQLSNGDDITCK